MNANRINITLVGVGDDRYRALLKNINSAVESLDLNLRITEVRDIETILSHNLVTTPALFINKNLITQGSVPESSEIANIISLFL
jgi:hypothetical protein